MHLTTRGIYELFDMPKLSLEMRERCGGAPVWRTAQTPVAEASRPSVISASVPFW